MDKLNQAIEETEDRIERLEALDKGDFIKYFALVSKALKGQDNEKNN